MWMMLQQDEPDDFVLATNESHSIRDFLNFSFSHLAIDDWSRFVEVDPRYFRPTEVNSLRGDYAKAKEALGWEPKVKCRELAEIMIDHDIQLARQETAQAGHYAS
jgi:GDPmannose 4,6-dehydratase